MSLLPWFPISDDVIDEMGKRSIKSIVFINSMSSAGEKIRGNQKYV
jgi:hypothetical protein